MENAPDHTILVINCGSSSIKFALVELPSGEHIASGIADRLGTPDASLSLRSGGISSANPLPSAAHTDALRAILNGLATTLGADLRIDGIGHRVVHGGRTFNAAARIDDSVLMEIDACARLAPLHNPANALGIRAAMAAFPNVPHVAVFDTAFHRTMPRHAALYAIPYGISEKYDIRRYGMHGTSHHYVGMEAARRLGKEFSEANLIVAHLGNGSSACAIRNGKSADTTMGLTPLEGLMMGTRSGDVDPDLYLFLHENLGLSIHEISELLNRKSGLLGVSGMSNDMRTLVAAAAEGNRRAETAIALLCYRLAKGISALCPALESLDALVFTGGIGENSTIVRERAVGHLKLLPLVLDPARNAAHGKGSGGEISTPDSPSKILVVPTDEESMIALSTATFCS